MIRDVSAFDDVVAFEWRYHTRQLSFVVAALGFLLFGFVLMSTGFGPDTVKLSAPWLVAEAVAFLSLLSVFALAIFASSSIVRDTDHRMSEILYSTPVSKTTYLGGRFAGAFFAGVTVFAMALVGMAIASQMPWQDPARSGAVALLPYLWAMVVMALPNLLFTSALLFAIAAMTRSTIASSVGAVAVYVLYFVAASLTNSPLMAAARPGQAGGMNLAALLDPFGLSAFFAQTHYWTIAQQNAQYPSLTGAFLVNRLAVLAVSALLVAGTIRFFSFRTPRSVKRKKGLTELEVPTSAVSTAPSRASAETFDTWRTSLRAYRRAASMEVRAAMGSLPFLIVLGLFVALLASEVVSEIRGNEYGSALLPATTILLGVLHNPLSLVGMLLIVYFSGEILWRDRRVRFADTLAATPAPGGVFVMARWTALAAMVLTLCVVSVVVCIVIQLASGYGDLRLPLYATLFLFEGLPLLLVAAAAVFLHTVSPNRHVGMMLTLVVALFTRQGAFGIEHHLVRFATAPVPAYSDMNGLGWTLEPFLWFMAWWTLIAVAMLLISARLWRRDAGAGLRVAARRLRGRALVAPAFCLAAAIVGSAWIFYNANVLHSFESTRDELDWRVGYERKYASDRSLPLPRVEAVVTKVAFHPEERRCSIEGRYTLVNATQQPVAKLHVAIDGDARNVRLTLNGKDAREVDARFGTHTFLLPVPLAPGGKASLEFSYEIAYRGFSNDPPEHVIARNGSFVWSFLHFPLLGYREGYETDDARAREKAGLPPRTVAASGEEEHARPSMDWIHFDAEVSTSAEQVAVSQGTLVRRWSANGRNYAHYRSETPMTNVFSFHSARYAVREARAGDVAVEMYYHPAHAANVERMIVATQKSLEQMSRTLTPYPHDHLRIIEVPAYARFAGFAMTGTVLVGEARGFLTDSRDPSRLDVVSRRIAHEVVHQWWGHTVSAASRPGASTITESLTKLGELEIMESMYGRDYVRRSLEFELDRYLKSRSARRERSLATVEGEPGVYYGKGSVVLMAVRELIGEERLHTALRNLIAAERGRGGNASVPRLLQELHAVAPEHRALIDEWFTKIVLYDFKLGDVRSVPFAGGHRVTIEITASKSLSDERGEEKPVALDEEIAFAVYGLTSQGALDIETPMLRKARLRSGRNEVTFIVDRKPEAVAVDPFITRVDRSPFDNMKRIE